MEVKAATVIICIDLLQGVEVADGPCLLKVLKVPTLASDLL